MGKYKSIWIVIGVVGVISIIVAVLFLYSKNASLSDLLNKSEESPCEAQIHQEFEGKVVKVKRYLYNNYKNKHFFQLIISSAVRDSLIYYSLPLHKYTDLKDCNGTSIKKEFGKDYFTVTFLNGEIKKYSVPNCNN